MKQLVYAKKNKLEWMEVERPQITGANQALVEPVAVARCDLDLPILQGATLFRPGFPVGHEFVARVVATSDDAPSNIAKGSLVAVPFQISCGICPKCVKGHSKSCSAVAYSSAYGMPPGAKQYGGALSDLLLVPFASQMILPLPPDADPVALASLSDNIVEAWKLAGCFLEEELRPVLILGGFASSIGLYTAALAHAMGAEVLYLDSDPERLSMAQKIGVTVETIGTLPKAWARAFPLVVDTSGTAEGYDFCLRSLDVEGICTSASIFWTNKLQFPYLELYNKAATVKIGRVNSREDMPKILRWIESGKFNPGNIVTRTAKWADAAEAWMEPAVKLVVTR